MSLSPHKALRDDPPENQKYSQTKVETGLTQKSKNYYKINRRIQMGNIEYDVLIRKSKTKKRQIHGDRHATLNKISPCDSDCCFSCCNCFGYPVDRRTTKRQRYLCCSVGIVLGGPKHVAVALQHCNNNMEEP